MVKISIIIPCYNKGQYLSETLNSVLNQEYSEWECLIVNDGSQDNSSQVAEEFCRKDTRFKYIFQENAGVSAARNNGIRSSSGQYILPLDADDLISKDYVSEAVKYMDEHPECKLVYPLVDFFDGRTGRFEIPEYRYSDEIWVNLIVCSAVFRRSDYDKTSGYNENMVYGLEDWDFWLSLLSEGDVVKRLECVGLFYRQVFDSRNQDAGKHLGQLKRQIVNNHRQLYEPYFDTIVTLQQEIYSLKEELNYLKNSRFFRTGKTIAKYYRKIRFRK